jgi:hypothetical protein
MSDVKLRTDAEIEASPYFAGWVMHGDKRSPSCYPLAINGVKVEVEGKTREEILAQIQKLWIEAGQ